MKRDQTGFYLAVNDPYPFIFYFEENRKVYFWFDKEELEIFDPIDVRADLFDAGDVFL